MEESWIDLGAGHYEGNRIIHDYVEVPEKRTYNVLMRIFVSLKKGVDELLKPFSQSQEIIDSFYEYHEFEGANWWRFRRTYLETTKIGEDLYKKSNELMKNFNVDLSDLEIIKDVISEMDNQEQKILTLALKQQAVSWFEEYLAKKGKGYVCSVDNWFNIVTKFSHTGNFSYLDVLINEFGADVNFKYDGSNRNALFVAVDKNDVDLAKFLIDRGIDVNTTETWGRTPLDMAIDLKKGEEIISVLLDAGCQRQKSKMQND